MSWFVTAALANTPTPAFALASPPASAPAFATGHILPLDLINSPPLFLVNRTQARQDHALAKLLSLILLLFRNGKPIDT